jgi:adenylate kinase family enzyme
VKIAIIGYSGSGKSTLAKRLANHVGCEPLYLDTVNFLPNWAERDRDDAREIVRRTLAKPDWVIDGNYRGLLREERLRDADEIVWLRYNRLTCAYRALMRHVTNRGNTRESMANGCIEKMDWEFFWWVVYKGRTRARVRDYLQTVARYADKSVVIRNDRRLRAYLAGKGIE